MSDLYRMTIAQFRAADENYEGFCLTCGDITNSGVEPDARGYECEVCGERTVYGVEEALLMGLISIEFEKGGDNEWTSSSDCESSDVSGT